MPQTVNCYCIIFLLLVSLYGGWQLVLGFNSATYYNKAEEKETERI